MYFNPSYLVSLIVNPLRYLFSAYGVDDMKWDTDPLKSSIDIGQGYDFAKIRVEQKPRITVIRGDYQVTTCGISDSLAESKGIRELRGKTDKINMVMINGSAQIILEARNPGTLERLTDVVTHYITWAAPLIADSNGFKNLGFPLSVSSLQLSKEDTELFQTTITLPWSREEQYRIQNGGVDLNNFVLSISPA